MAIHLRTLSDEELAHHADRMFDPLVSSDLEVELARRFADCVGAATERDELQEKLDNLGDTEALAKLAALRDEFAGWDISGLLGVLSDYDIDSPEELRKVLQRDADMQPLLDDLAEPIARLHSITNPTPATKDH